MGSKGSGYPTIPDADQKRLDKLLLKLPDDGGRLPPPGRRVVLQVPEGVHCRVRVYDRAHAPDEVLEILRLSLSGIRSWVPKIKSESEIQIGGHAHYGILALTPGGQLVHANSDKWFTSFWDPVTHESVKYAIFMIPDQIQFSPDGSAAVLCDTTCCQACVVDAQSWALLRDLSELVPNIGYKAGTLPWFSPDGKYLLLQRRPVGIRTETELWIYDTKTWKRKDKLPGLPDGIIGYFEAPKSKRAVVLSENRTLTLWDTGQHKTYAILDKEVFVRQIAFSPDETMVALATLHKRDDYWTIFRIRILKMATGELVHELRPFEQGTCENVVGLQWTPDAQYILANGIDIWSVKSGRHCGSLTRGLSRPMGVVLLPDGRHVASAGGGDDNRATVIRFWDLAAALKQIRAFEDSLAEPKAGK